MSAIGLLLVLAPLTPDQEHTPSTCSLRPVNEQWEGACPAIAEGEDGTLSITRATKITSGRWRPATAPSMVFAGTIVLGKYPPTPVELEIYNDSDGALRTLFGWFPVRHFRLTPGAMQISIDFSQEAAPSAIDRDIVKRARAILSSEAVWDRADDRQCDAGDTSWSIYCAMKTATVEVAGAFHHRRPALQVVRQIVDERTEGRAYEHRLRDYNNDPTTRLADVSSMFQEALARIDAAIERARERERAGGMPARQ